MAALTSAVFTRRALLGLAGAALLTGCDNQTRGQPTPSTAWTSPVPTTPRRCRSPTPTARPARWPTGRASWWWCSSATPNAPDVCPTTLARTAQVRQALGPDGDKLQGVFVTVDPARDTAALLKDYVNNFGAGFVGPARPRPSRPRPRPRPSRCSTARCPGKTETSYTMDHTAGSYVFDTQGRIRLFERHGTGVKFLTEDFKALLAGA